MLPVNVLPGTASEVDSHFKMKELKYLKTFFHLCIIRARQLLPKCYLSVASVFVSKCLCLYGADIQCDLLFLDVSSILKKCLFWNETF